MKRRIRLRLVAMVVIASLCALVLEACSSSLGPEKYVVFQTKTAGMDGVMEYYQVVLYRETGKKDDIEVIKHKNDLLTGLVDEVHLQKSSYTESEVKEFADTVYEDIDSIDCGTRSITDEGDYYCVLYQFTGLDKSSNVEELTQKGILTTSEEEGESSDKVSAGTVMQSIRFTLGTTELTEEEAAKLDLHFKVE